MAVIEISTALLNDIKISLGITWTDDITDSAVRNYIRNGEAYINDKLGEIADFEEAGYARQLLMDYVRYARDNALDVFENNFRSYILAMQNKKAVSDYVASAEQTG